MPRLEEHQSYRPALPAHALQSLQQYYLCVVEDERHVLSALLVCDVEALGEREGRVSLQAQQEELAHDILFVDGRAFQFSLVNQVEPLHIGTDAAERLHLLVHRLQGDLPGEPLHGYRVVGYLHALYVGGHALSSYLVNALQGESCHPPLVLLHDGIKGRLLLRACRLTLYLVLQVRQGSAVFLVFGACGAFLLFGGYLFHLWREVPSYGLEERFSGMRRFTPLLHVRVGGHELLFVRPHVGFLFLLVRLFGEDLEGIRVPLDLLRVSLLLRHTLGQCAGSRERLYYFLRWSIVHSMYDKV